MIDRKRDASTLEFLEEFGELLIGTQQFDISYLQHKRQHLVRPLPVYVFSEFKQFIWSNLIIL